MAQELASKQLIWYDKEAAEAGLAWHCGDCGSFIKGMGGYDRHVSCFPLHHPRADATPLAAKSLPTEDAS
jgi:hypothetical protein